MRALVLAGLIFVALPTSSVYATEPKTAEECNQAMMDRWGIEEPRNYQEVNVVATFYTSLEVCNGKGNAGRNAVGGYLSETSIAVPRGSMPFGTELYLEGIGTRIVDDVGNPKYIRIRPDGTYRMDVYMPRIPGESDTRYKKRIMDMGVFKTTAKLYLWG